jgi:hypothetical protein
MIIGNKIISGCGTILVGANCDGTIQVQHIDPNAVIGEDVTEEFLKNVSIVTTLRIKSLPDLLSKLRNVTEENPTFQHDNYIIDFSEYNEDSVQVWIRQTKRALNAIQMAFAC